MNIKVNLIKKNVVNTDSEIQKKIKPMYLHKLKLIIDDCM